MTDASKKVLAGFSRLSPDERKEVIEKMNEFIHAEASEKKMLREGFEKAAGVLMGPVDTGCPCCGR